MSLAVLFHFLCAQHVSDINISIIRSLRLFCWIATLVILFLVLCVLEFRCGWVGMVSVLHWLCWLWLALVVELRRDLHAVYTAHDAAPHNHSQYNQCRTSYAVVHGLVMLMMGIMMPETCWDRSLIINIGLVASCWFLSLHPKTELFVHVLQMW